MTRYWRCGGTARRCLLPQPGGVCTTTALAHRRCANAIACRVNAAWIFFQFAADEESWEVERLVVGRAQLNVPITYVHCQLFRRLRQVAALWAKLAVYGWNKHTWYKISFCLLHLKVFKNSAVFRNTICCQMTKICFKISHSKGYRFNLILKFINNCFHETCRMRIYKCIKFQIRCLLASSYCCKTMALTLKLIWPTSLFRPRKACEVLQSACLSLNVSTKFNSFFRNT